MFSLNERDILLALMELATINIKIKMNNIPKIVIASKKDEEISRVL